MLALVLGAAAGGAFPQWNSNAPACRRARAGDEKAKPRTQASVAVTNDQRHWFLLNASPDIRQQIESNRALHPSHSLRSTPIAGVALTGGDVDAIAGLLTLRERQPFTVWATASVHGILTANPIFNVLADDVVRRQVVALEATTSLDLPSGEPSGLRLELFAVPGKVPLYLEDEAVQAGTAPPTIAENGQTVGAMITDGRKRFFFIPGCAAVTPALAERLRGADLLMFDGTLWRDDEMITARLGSKTGKRMGHMSVSGADGTIAAMQDLSIARKVLIHINNSNPILIDDSPERHTVEAAGWQVAFDGMELDL
jgi:pyrroloquinoline quinone biosynthesis protein B